MNDTDADKNSTDQTAASPRGKKAAKEPRGRVRGGLALILASLALIASGYIWYTVLYRNAGLFSGDVIAALDRVETASSQNQEAIADTEKEIKTFKETQDTLRASLDKINTDLVQNRMEWALTETEQLLVIANNRLQLAHDVHSALAALRAADEQLKILARPKLLPVRRELAREISQLESLDKTDISGITLRLVTMADNVDRLPLALDIRQAEETQSPVSGKPGGVQLAAAESGWRQTARSVWHDILSLVRIRDNVTAQRPLLPPEQQYFLRENLRLMLYSAQQALLQGSIATYQQNLKSAQRLLKDYFDVNSQSVAAMRDEVGKLLSMKIVTELPDISASLTTLRHLSGQRAEP
ncbi:MAG: uroporphyrinogen-III C-methyltransferase [Sulfuricaulis sp.]